jgi:hypothetical protein
VAPDAAGADSNGARYAMEKVVLHPGSSREAIGWAGEVLAAYLKEFCDAAARSLQEQRDFLSCCLPLRDEGLAKPGAWELDLLDVTRAIRRVERARQRPLPRAVRELRRLKALLEGVPFERLVVGPESLTACLPPVAPEGMSTEAGSAEICLPRPSSTHFPVFIRKPSAAGEELMFVHGGRHGACRGAATPLLEMAVERMDLCGLVLIALTWARRNL